MPLSTTGRELQRLREELGITRAEVAREAGVSVPAVHSVEASEQLRTETYFKYALAISRLDRANAERKPQLALALLTAALELFTEIVDIRTASRQGVDAA